MKQYIFNYTNDTNLPPYGEENIYINNYVKISCCINFDSYIQYYIDDIPDGDIPVIEINKKIILMLITTTNSAHSLSEIIDFVNYYKKESNSNNLVGISDFIVSRLPFLFELIKLFIPENNIIILNVSNIYKFDTIITYRNLHINCLNDWKEIPFIKENNIIYFNNLQNVRNKFQSDPSFLFEKIEEIYNEHKHKYNLYDNIMLIKTGVDKYVFSRNRCMEVLEDNIKEILNSKNIKVISVNDFKNIYEYICVFYHAKNIVTSYGGVACTNRFFCNPNANVILIGNLHYKHEYDYDNETHMYWHLRFSHIFVSNKQKVLLDFENKIHIDNLNKILNLLEPPNPFEPVSPDTNLPVSKKQQLPRIPMQKNILHPPSKVANVIGLMNIPAFNLSVGGSNMTWHRKKMTNFI